MKSNNLKFSVYHKHDLVANVEIIGMKVFVEQFGKGFLNPFGNWQGEIPLDVYSNWIESRVIPQSRDGLDDYLDALGVPYYNPMMIIEKTHGTMVSDHWWIKFEGEDNLTYEQARDY